jgi:hypothetical protein
MMLYKSGRKISGVCLSPTICVMAGVWGCSPQQAEVHAKGVDYEPGTDK